MYTYLCICIYTHIYIHTHIYRINQDSMAIVLVLCVYVLVQVVSSLMRRSWAVQDQVQSWWDVGLGPTRCSCVLIDTSACKPMHAQKMIVSPYSSSSILNHYLNTYWGPKHKYVHCSSFITNYYFNICWIPEHRSLLKAPCHVSVSTVCPILSVPCVYHA